MTAEQLFSTLNLIAVAGWLLLVFLPRMRWTSTVVPIVMPSVFAVRLSTSSSAGGRSVTHSGMALPTCSSCQRWF
jgi:hypothetical protein